MMTRTQYRDNIFETEINKISRGAERHLSSIYLLKRKILYSQTIEYEEMMMVDMNLTYYSESFISYLKEKLKLIYSELEYEIVRGLICCINAYGMYDYENDQYFYPDSREEFNELFDDIHFYDGPYKALQLEIFENKGPILVKDLGNVPDMMELIISYFEIDDHWARYLRSSGIFDILKYIMDKKYPLYNLHSRKTFEDDEYTDEYSPIKISEFDKIKQPII